MTNPMAPSIQQQKNRNKSGQAAPPYHSENVLSENVPPLLLERVVRRSWVKQPRRYSSSKKNNEQKDVTPPITRPVNPTILSKM